MKTGEEPKEKFTRGGDWQFFPNPDKDFKPWENTDFLKTKIGKSKISLDGARKTWKNEVEKVKGVA